MASVEGAVRPALESMISGYGIGLTAEAQLAVAAWAAMRAAMFEYLWTDDPVLTAADRATIMSRDRLPSGFRARMALAASPGWPLQALGHVSELRGPRGRALCLTITAGRLVVQVFGGPGADAHHLRAAGQPEAGWIGISSPRAPVVWPLESALDDLGACLPWRPSPAGMLGSQ